MTQTRRRLLLLSIKRVMFKCEKISALQNVCICVSNGVDGQGGGRGGGGLISYSVSAKSTPPLLCTPKIFFSEPPGLIQLIFDPLFDKVWQVHVTHFSAKLLSVCLSCEQQAFTALS